MTRDDIERVGELLGRAPQGRFVVVTRDDNGDPVVIRNDPFLDDGTPMPTRYWLVGPEEIRRIGQLEASGGVSAAERAVDPADLAAAHQRYAAERDTAIDADYTGPRPSGGVGGTRQGVKCLHAHWAWHLAGGTDPVGAWIARQFGVGTIRIESDNTSIDTGSGVFVIPWGDASLTSAWLESNPPRPEELTNALGAIDDHVEDLEREHPGFDTVDDLTFCGPAALDIARLEVGRVDVDSVLVLNRDDVEALFRLVTAETDAERAQNPGLEPARAGTIVGALCIVLAIARRRRLDTIRFDTAP